MSMTTAMTVTFEQVVDLVLPETVVPPGEGCLKLVALPVGVAMPVEEVAWFQRLPTWVRLRRYWPKESPETLAQFLGAHQESVVAFSPVAWNGPNGASRGPVAACWATLPIATEPAAHMPGLQRVDPTAAARARALVEAMTPSPSVVIDEGSRLALAWLLVEPVGLPQAEATSTMMTCRLRGVPQVWPAEPLVGLLIGVPNTRNPRLFPTPTVTIALWEPERRYTVAALAEAVGLERSADAPR